MRRCVVVKVIVMVIFLNRRNGCQGDGGGHRRDG